MNMSSPSSKSKDLYGRDEPCGIARTAFHDQFATARERYAKTSPVKRTKSMEGAPSVRDRMKSFTQQNSEAVSDLVRHTSTTKKPTDEIVPVVSPRGRDTQRSQDCDRTPTYQLEHETIPAKQKSDDEASVSSEESSSSGSSDSSSFTSESGRWNIRKKNEAASATETVKKTKPCGRDNDSCGPGVTKVTPGPSNTRRRKSSDTSVKAREMSSESDPVSNRQSSTCVNSPSKSRDLYGRDEPCGIARTSYDGQFEAARERYKKTPVKRTPSMEGVVSLQDRMKSFTQQPPESHPIYASPDGTRTALSGTSKTYKTLDNIASRVQGTGATSSVFSMTAATNSTPKTASVKGEYSDEVSASSESASEASISCRDDDSSRSSYRSSDDSSSSSGEEPETLRQSSSTFETKRHETRSKQGKEESVITVETKGPETPKIHRNAYSCVSPVLSKPEQTMLAETDPVSNGHYSICVSSPSKSRDLYGRDEPCGIARTSYDGQFEAARERYKKTPVKRTPSMEGAVSLRDRMKSFMG